jgi:hypothetical protein
MFFIVRVLNYKKLVNSAEFYRKARPIHDLYFILSVQHLERGLGHKIELKHKDKNE